MERLDLEQRHFWFDTDYTDPTSCNSYQEVAQCIRCQEPVKPLNWDVLTYEPLHRSIYSIGSSEELYALHGDVRRSPNSTGICILL